MAEKWRDVVTVYEVSNTGRVRNKNTGRMLKAHVNPDNYLNYNLIMTGHKLVAEAFVPNPDNLPVVHHIDHNRQNNKLENLMRCTQAVNMQSRKMSKNNTSGINGVVYKHNRYRARLCTGYKFFYLGSYDTSDEAEFVRLWAEHILWTNIRPCNRARFIELKKKLKKPPIERYPYLQHLRRKHEEKLKQTKDGQH